MKQAVLAAALVAAATATFAQAVQSSSDTPVTSGTGVVVTPGVLSSTTVATTTSVPTTDTLPAPRMSGAVMAQASTSETVNGNTRTVTTRYWANVPAGVDRDARFQRWQRLK
jgi:hypothetical protein